MQLVQFGSEWFREAVRRVDRGLDVSDGYLLVADQFADFEVSSGYMPGLPGDHRGLSDNDRCLIVL